MKIKLVTGPAEFCFAFAVSSSSVEGLNTSWQKKETPLEPFAPLSLQKGTVVPLLLFPDIFFQAYLINEVGAMSGQ